MALIRRHGVFMFKKVAIGILSVLVLFLGYVSTREGKFNYEKSGVINAPKEKVFPYISDLKLGGEWSPYEKIDPRMKKEFIGTPNAVGAKMNFAGNSDAGSGSLEIVNIVPNESVDIRLIMTAPFHAENMIHYQLTTEGGATRFSWSMSGDGGFLGKLISVFIDCEKMVTDQFGTGINNLKTLIESQK